MKIIILICLYLSLAFSSELDEATTFQANFVETITKDKYKHIIKGTVKSSISGKSQWTYITPEHLTINAVGQQLAIIDKENKTVLYSRMIGHEHIIASLGVKIPKTYDMYTTHFGNIEFIMQIKGNYLLNIFFTDKLGYSHKILFTRQKLNKDFDIDISLSVSGDFKAKVRQ